MVRSEAHLVEEVYAMVRAVRYMFVVAAIAAIAMAASGSPSGAAVAVPNGAANVAFIQPASGAVVGVGHPVVVTFTGPVADRAAAERTIKITSPSHPTGRFNWVDDNVVQWIPDKYWPAHTKVTVQVHALTTGFETGRRSGRRCQHFGAHIHRQRQRPGAAGDASVDG